MCYTGDVSRSKYVAHRHYEDHQTLTGVPYVLDQWIERPGVIFKAYGRLVRRLSYGATLTKDFDRAHRFADRRMVKGARVRAVKGRKVKPGTEGVIRWAGQTPAVRAFYGVPD